MELLALLLVYLYLEHKKTNKQKIIYFQSQMYLLKRIIKMQFIITFGNIFIVGTWLLTKN